MTEKLRSIGELTPLMIAQSRVIAKGNRIRDVQRLVETYGGKKSEWVKKAVRILKSAIMNTSIIGMNILSSDGLN